MKVTIDQHEDIEMYAGRIIFDVIRMVTNYSSFMARDIDNIDNRHEDKFVELMLFEISALIISEAILINEKNNEKNLEKELTCEYKNKEIQEIILKSNKIYENIKKSEKYNQKNIN